MTDAQACQKLIDRLSSGASVEVKEIYKYLSHDDAALLRQRLGELRDQRKWYDEAKRELREYTQLLRIGDLINGRAERLSDSSHRRRNSKVISSRKSQLSVHKSLREQAESKYEKALERLSELLAGREDLAAILDRNFIWDTSPGKETVSPDKEGMPRFSFPHHNANEVKMAVLRETISNTHGTLQIDINAEADQQKLNSMLKALKKVT